MHTFKKMVLASSILALTGCADMNIAGVDLGRLNSVVQKTSDLGEKSQDEEMTIGKEMASTLLGAAPLANNHTQQQYVNRVGHWVALQSERPDLSWHFAVLNDQTVNAFAAPGGYVFITEGMLRNLNNEAELAGVLAHEISHVVAKHHLKAIQTQAQLGIATDIGMLLKDVAQQNSGGGGGAGDEALEKIASATKTLYSRGLDKSDEYQADAMGIVLMARAGYDPYAYINVLQKMNGMSSNNSSLALLFKTHPRPEDRLTHLQPVVGNLAQQGTLPMVELDSRFRSVIR